MKKYLATCLLFLTLQHCHGQSINDIGRIVLNNYVIDPENKLTNEVKEALEAKLSAIAADNGIGGTSITPQFILAVKTIIQSKDIISGPPQLIALNTEFVFQIGDAVNNTLYSSTSLKVKSVGTNETKAFIAAINNINPNSTQFSEFIKNGKTKILEHYNSQCEIRMQKVSALVSQKNYEAALFELYQVPELSKECYTRSMNSVGPIYQKYIYYNCLFLLAEAKIKWKTNPNKNGAEEAGQLLSKINPTAECYTEVEKLIDVIEKRCQKLKKEIGI